MKSDSSEPSLEHLEDDSLSRWPDTTVEYELDCVAGMLKAMEDREDKCKLYDESYNDAWLESENFYSLREIR